MYKAIHDTISSNAKLCRVSDFAFRVWFQGLTQTDIFGRITGHLREFWARVTPLNDTSPEEVRKALDELSDAGLVHPYDVKEKRYYVWHDHGEHNSKLRNLKNQKARCPSPPPDLCECIEGVATSGTDLTHDRTDDRRQERISYPISSLPISSGVGGTLREQNGRQISPSDMAQQAAFDAKSALFHKLPKKEQDRLLKLARKATELLPGKVPPEELDACTLLLAINMVKVK